MSLRGLRMFLPLSRQIYFFQRLNSFACPIKSQVFCSNSRAFSSGSCQKSLIISASIKLRRWSDSDSDSRAAAKSEVTDSFNPLSSIRSISGFLILLLLVIYEFIWIHISGLLLIAITFIITIHNRLVVFIQVSVVLSSRNP